MINYQIIARTNGMVLSILGLLMMLPLFVSYYYDSSGDNMLFLSAAITFLSGETLRYYGKSSTATSIGRKEGYIIVVLAWVSMSLFSILPYYLGGYISDFTKAFFESVSGLTTTGATVIKDIESLPKGILFWRSLTQWIGGMGIIVLTVAIFPLFGLSGVELYRAEVPGPSKERLHPRVLDTARMLWGVYIGLTVLLILLLFCFGMTFYDAINHGFTTMATGGFSTKNASIAAFSDRGIQYILLLFMFLAGSNYAIVFYALKREWKKVYRHEEFVTYTTIMLLLSLSVGAGIYFYQDVALERAFRDGAFQVVSIVTTTGFVSADYTQFFPSSSVLFFFLLFTGACSGSTSGGVKIIRHLVLFKHIKTVFSKLVNPRLVVPLQLHDKAIKKGYLQHITGFIVTYGFLFLIGCLLMSFILSGTEDVFETALTAVATCLGNVGPGLGGVGPTDNFSELPHTGYWLLIFYMLLGRLELFSVLVLFFPYFWKQ